MEENRIRLCILDDHPGMIDGYRYRLSADPGIEIVAAIRYGEELEPLLACCPVDVLLLDVHVPTSPSNPNPYPILHLISNLLQKYQDLSILVISMFSQRTLIRSVMDAGASGYILKDDQEILNNLAETVRLVAGGGIRLSRAASLELHKRNDWLSDPVLSPRQLEALSLCASYPDKSTADLARQMNVAHSTLRNLLSGAYLKLEVRTRAAAVARARQLGIISPDSFSLDISKLNSSPE